MCRWNYSHPTFSGNKCTFKYGCKVVQKCTTEILLFLKLLGVVQPCTTGDYIPENIMYPLIGMADMTKNILEGYNNTLQLKVLAILFNY